MPWGWSTSSGRCTPLASHRAGDVRRRRDPDPTPSGDGNGTGAFVCRPTTGETFWSAHASGLALDLNPFQNPHRRDDLVLPELADSYLDRGWRRPGMITADGVVTRAFARIGWSWGGGFQSLRTTSTSRRPAVDQGSLFSRAGVAVVRQGVVSCRVSRCREVLVLPWNLRRRGCRAGRGAGLDVGCRRGGWGRRCRSGRWGLSRCRTRRGSAGIAIGRGS